MNYQARARDPEVTAEEIAYLAESFPEDVLQNEALLLLSLEKPLLYEFALSVALLSRWESELTQRLQEGGERLWRFFAADCTERGLARLSELSGETIEPARSYVRGARLYSQRHEESGWKAATLGFDPAHPSIQALREVRSANSLYHAVRAARYAAEGAGSSSAKSQPSFWNGPPVPPNFRRARGPWVPLDRQRVAGEIAWQQERLAFYLEGEGRKLVRERSSQARHREFEMLRSIAGRATRQNRGWMRLLAGAGLAWVLWWFLQ